MSSPLALTHVFRADAGLAAAAPASETPPTIAVGAAPADALAPSASDLLSAWHTGVAAALQGFGVPRDVFALIRAYVPPTAELRWRFIAAAHWDALPQRFRFRGVDDQHWQQCELLAYAGVLRDAPLRLRTLCALPDSRLANEPERRPQDGHPVVAIEVFGPRVDAAEAMAAFRLALQRWCAQGIAPDRQAAVAQGNAATPGTPAGGGPVAAVSGSGSGSGAAIVRVEPWAGATATPSRFRVDPRADPRYAVYTGHVDALCGQLQVLLQDWGFVTGGQPWAVDSAGHELPSRARVYRVGAELFCFVTDDECPAVAQAYATAAANGTSAAAAGAGAAPGASGGAAASVGSNPTAAPSAASAIPGAVLVRESKAKLPPYTWRPLLSSESRGVFLCLSRARPEGTEGVEAASARSSIR